MDEKLLDCPIVCESYLWIVMKSLEICWGLKINSLQSRCMVAKGYRTCRTTWSNDKRMSLPNLMTITETHPLMRVRQKVIFLQVESSRGANETVGKFRTKYILVHTLFCHYWGAQDILSWRYNVVIHDYYDVLARLGGIGGHVSADLKHHA